MKASFTHANPKANKGIKHPKPAKGNNAHFTQIQPKRHSQQLPAQPSLATFLKKK